MSLSNPRTLYGIHSVSPYSRTDGTFYGILKVLEGSSLGMSGSLVELEGGSSKFAWAVEAGLIKTEVQLKVGEYPDFLYALFFGQTPVAVAADAAGTISTALNKLGTSVVAATGLASVVVIPTTGAPNLKFGKYKIKVASATTVNVYASTDIDFGRGTAGSYSGDDLQVAGPLTITTGANTDIAAFGIRLTGGAGTIAMVVGDTAEFEVLPPSTKSMSVSVGSASTVFPEFGMIAMAQKTGSKQLTELDIYRCKGVGFPIGFNMNAFSKSDIKIAAFYDSVKDSVYKERWIEEA
jgi:hypothetical protein